MVPTGHDGHADFSLPVARCDVHPEAPLEIVDLTDQGPTENAAQGIVRIVVAWGLCVQQRDHGTDQGRHAAVVLAHVIPEIHS